MYTTQICKNSAKQHKISPVYIAPTMSTYSYPVDALISYEDTPQYRQCVRTIFNMQPQETPDDADEETKDEQEYDYDSTAHSMDHIFEITHANPVFKKLIMLAAAKIMTTDPSIGISILFSYDYLELFHKCLVLFITTPDEFTEDADIVTELKNKLR